jgi:hypothetical protein
VAFSRSGIHQKFRGGRNNRDITPKHGCSGLQIDATVKCLRLRNTMLLSAEGPCLSDYAACTGFALILTACLLVWIERPEPRDEIRRIAEHMPVVDGLLGLWILVEYAYYGRWRRSPGPLLLGLSGAALLGLGLWL